MTKPMKIPSLQGKLQELGYLKLLNNLNKK